MKRTGVPQLARLELYQAATEEWRWRLVVSNGNLIADCGEGYASKQGHASPGAKRGIQSVKQRTPNAQGIVSD